MIKIALYFIIVVSLFIPFTLTRAQNNLVIQHLSSEPQLDGSPFEGVWTVADPCSMVMMYPETGINPSQKSEFKIGITDKYLYVAGFMYDTEPDKIRAASKKRDANSPSNDWFCICLDTYNDNENAVCIATNPAGLRLDAQIVNDGEGDFFQIDWNTVWETATVVTDEGWFAEMRIPFSSLRYLIQDGQATMGVLCWRYISRLNEAVTYPLISNEWGFYSWARPSQYEDITLKGISNINPLYFTPYVLGGLEQRTFLNEGEDAYETGRAWEKQAGIDIKYGISKSFTLDLTANTDFAQVEADNQQVNLTRFSLFFPEKRQFFLERSSIFNFTFGSSGQLFYSRRIGLDNGKKVPIWGGGRVIGRAGDWDIGFMSLQTGKVKDEETGEEVIPTANNSVIRLRKKLSLNMNSYAGGLVTSKIDPHGNYHVGIGMDAILNLFGNDYLNLAVARTMDTLQKDKSLLEPARLYFQWERRTYKGLSYAFHYARAGSMYRPELGFEYRKDFSNYRLQLAYGWMPGDKNPILKQHQVWINTYIYQRNEDRKTESARLNPSYQFYTKRDHGITISLPVSFENVTGSFSLSPSASIPPGDYAFLEIGLEYSSPYYDVLHWQTSFSTGTYYDGWKNSFTANASIIPNESWNINLSFQVNQITFSSREQKFNSQLGSIRILYMYSTAVSASSFLQYSNLNKGFVWNVRFRYNPKEGNDFYIVYNDDLNTARSRNEPVMPVSNQRTILLKYTYTFRVR